MNLNLELIISELVHRLTSFSSHLSQADSEVIDEILKDTSLYKIKTAEFVDLLRDAQLILREYDYDFFLALTIVELCAEIGLKPHAELLTDIAVWNQYVIPRNIDKINPVWLLEYATQHLNNANTRSNAILLLGHLPDDYGLSLLLSLLDNHNDQLPAIEALGKKESSLAIDPLIEILPTATEETRLSIIKTLGEIGSPTVIPQLVIEYQHGSKAIADACLLAFLKIGRNPAYDALLTLLQNVDKPSILILLNLIQINPVRAKKDIQSYLPTFPSHRQAYLIEEIQRQIDTRKDENKRI